MSMLLVRPCLRWNENFFKNDAGGDYSLTRFALGVAPVFHEFESGLVKLLQTAEWDDSEVALLYSLVGLWRRPITPDLAGTSDAIKPDQLDDGQRGKSPHSPTSVALHSPAGIVESVWCRRLMGGHGLSD